MIIKPILFIPYSVASNCRKTKVRPTYSIKSFQFLYKPNVTNIYIFSFLDYNAHIHNYLLADHLEKKTSQKLYDSLLLLAVYGLIFIRRKKMLKKMLYYSFLFVMMLFFFMTIVVVGSLTNIFSHNSSDYSLGFFPFDIFHFVLTTVALGSTVATIGYYVRYRREHNLILRKQKQTEALAFTTFSHFISMCTIFFITAQLFAMNDWEAFTQLLSYIIMLNFVLLLLNIVLTMAIQREKEDTAFYQASYKVNHRLHQIFFTLLILALLYNLLFSFTLFVFLLLLVIFLLSSVIYLLEITK